MKSCEAGQFCKCGGRSTETKHFEVYSGDRFWGVVAYCHWAFEADEAKGYKLLEVVEQQTYTL